MRRAICWVFGLRDIILNGEQPGTDDGCQNGYCRLDRVETLAQLVPGIAARDTLLYGVEAKIYSSRFKLTPKLETQVRNMFAAGDGAGVSRGLKQTPLEDEDYGGIVVMSNTERLVMLIVLILVGLAFSILLEPPAVWLLAGVLVTMVCVGTDNLIHMHWRVHIRRRRYAISLWIIPALLVLGSIFFLRLPLFSNGIAVAIGLVVVGVLLALVIVSEYRTIDPDDQLYGIARFILNTVGYVTAFTLYTTIYGSKARSIMTATAIIVISALIALELLRDTEADVTRTWLYAAICGVVMGELTWALNYWQISALVGGILLLLAFYALTGLVQNHLLGKLNRQVATEFGVVTAIGLMCVFVAMIVANRIV